MNTKEFYAFQGDWLDPPYYFWLGYESPLYIYGVDKNGTSVLLLGAEECGEASDRLAGWAHYAWWQSEKEDREFLAHAEATAIEWPFER